MKKIETIIKLLKDCLKQRINLKGKEKWKKSEVGWSEKRIKVIIKSRSLGKEEFRKKKKNKEIILEDWRRAKKGGEGKERR